MSFPVVWSVSELAEMTKQRILNKYDSNIAVTGLTGKGKCQPKGSKILMADGSWKNIEDIKRGDLILSPQKDGSCLFCRVTQLSKWFCNDVYEIIQLNKEKKKLYSCSDNHIIPYLYRQNPRVNGFRNNKVYKWIYKEISAKEFSEFGKSALGHKKIGFSSFKIDKFFGRKNCEIEPYTLGVWLGDGHFSSNKKYSRAIGITSNDFEVLEEVSKFYPIMSIAKKQKTDAKTYRFSLNGELSKLLNRYGLEGKGSGEKFIPKEALLSNYYYRIRLLAGLIDTDGYYTNGGYQFTLKSKRLIEDIKNLVYSLGGRTGEIRGVKKKSQNGTEGIYYSLSIYLKDIKIPLMVKHKIKKESSVYLDSNRIAIEVIKSKPSMVYGFSIDSPSKWYITDNWMVTHNSTFFWKFFHKFPDFKVEDKLTFGREEMIRLIRDYKKSYCWNDELISAGNKRKFYETEQIELIEILTKYRDNLNIVGGAVPIFFSLDKELLKLFGMHINIIDRGIGVVHLPREGRMYSEDAWDVKINAKQEEKWSEKIQKNPNFKIPYHRYTTFAGYVYFGKLTDKQEEYYLELKRMKRAESDTTIKEDIKEDFYKKVLGMVKDKKLTEDNLLSLCLYEGKKLSSVRIRLNQMLKDLGDTLTLKDYLLESNKVSNTDILHNNNIVEQLIKIDTD